VLLGALILGAFFVMSISAYYILRKRHVTFSERSFTIALVMGLLTSLAALVSGHEQANKVAETQPAKLAAFEGHFKTENKGTSLYVLGVPNTAEQRVDYGIAVPGMLSWLIHGDSSKPVTALDTFKPEDRPPVPVPFYSYHLMVGIGFFSIALTVLAAFLRWRGTLFQQRWLMTVFVFAVAGPYLANQAGWVAAEVGRQPWIVYGLLRTSDGLSKAVKANQVLGSIVMFTVIYGLLFAIWVYVLNDKIKHGPEAPHGQPIGPHEGLLEAAAALAEHGSGHSLTRAHEDAAAPKETG
jgi:cytochrome d ubiquinol oxidase subunit I